MCENCNTTRSQPFDVAYDTFISYCHSNVDAIAESASFEFSAIYGSGWREGRAALLKYWAKHVACRAAEIGIAVPQALRDHLSDLTTVDDPPHVGLALGINAIALPFALEGEALGSWFSDANGFTDRATGKLAAFESTVGWEWLVVAYRFDALDRHLPTSMPGNRVDLPNAIDA